MLPPHGVWLIEANTVSGWRRGCWRRPGRGKVFLLVLFVFACRHLLTHITESSEGKLLYFTTITDIRIISQFDDVMNTLQNSYFAVMFRCQYYINYVKQRCGDVWSTGLSVELGSSPVLPCRMLENCILATWFQITFLYELITGYREW